MNLFRNTLVAVVALVGTSAYAAVDRPECVAPAEPGGGFDLTCRIAQEGLGDSMGSPIQVSFMPGGIGAVAFNLFNTTRTNDQNAIVAFSTGSLLNIATGKFSKEFNEKNVRWVATAGADFGAVVVKADSEFETLAQLMDKMKADPGSVVLGAGGSVGSQDWMKAALLLKAVGGDPKKMRYVAFDGGGESIAALLGGSIQVYTGDVGEMASHMEAGDMRVLAVLSPERLPAPFDQTPTAKELGYDVEWTIMRGYYMGGKVDDADYNAWVDAFNAAYKTDEFKALQAEKGLMPLDLSGAELTATVDKQVETLRQIAKDAGLIE